MPELPSEPTPPAVPAPVAEESILCATDLSPASQQAVGLAAELARIYGAKLLVAHALELWDKRYDFLVQDLEQRLGREAHAWATQELQRLGQTRPVPVEVLVQRGSTHEQVLKLIRERHPRLLVIGCNSSAKPGETYLGGMAEELLRLSPTPVLVARPSGTPRLRHILCAVGGAEASRNAFEYALDIATRAKAERLSVVHAYHVPVGYLEAGMTGEAAAAKMRQIHQQDLDKLLLPYRNGPLVIRTLLEEGPAAQAIAAAAAREKADLLVIGTESRFFFATLILGNIASRIVRHAQVPVLVVKSGKHKAGLLAALERL